MNALDIVADFLAVIILCATIAGLFGFAMFLLAKGLREFYQTDRKGLFCWVGTITVIVAVLWAFIHLQSRGIIR